MLVLLFMLLVVVELGWAAQCDKWSGPAGTVECIQIQRYNNEYQWATCLTDVYIKLKSNHTHLCIDRTRVYCWYQCMLEENNKEDGPVTSDCSCSPSNPTSYPNTLTPTTLLPSQCYSPPGDSCGWYRNCLERKYPCEATSNGYAIRYAENFCNLYNENLGKFSLTGKNWVNGVRKCLQVSLVPLLRPWANPTCKEIRDRAFASHTPCYLYPDKGVPSVCDLDCHDYYQIFWTIKGSFIKVDTLWESLKGMWNIGNECGWSANNKKCYRELKDGPVRAIKMKIKRFLRLRRSTDPLPESDAQSRFAEGVGSAIASALRWNSEVMDWLAYTGRVEDAENLEMVVLLADKKALGIVLTSIPFVDFNQIIQVFASAVRKGALPLRVEGHNVWVRTLASCSDKACNSTQTLAVSDKPPNWNGAAEISRGKVVMCGTIAVLIMMINKLFY
ncbi:uncharacterized protein LOC111339722 [Stylophora pistillata]|uniref:Uncharacterized protein n=1 Tax=Stylophora pistillata TaxID=50429 RepID=A0A2B4RPM7_STYPI|nr:uncharacterized protein LOC111339722 [Stylophora pistillata]PFX18297.1 hypothetical protein AWC38_SpisGene17343 [Stylophora pistillata]